MLTHRVVVYVNVGMRAAASVSEMVKNIDSTQCQQNQLCWSYSNQKTESTRTTEVVIDEPAPDTIGGVMALMKEKAPYLAS